MQNAIRAVWRSVVMVFLVVAVTTGSFVAGYGSHWSLTGFGEPPPVPCEPLGDEGDEFRSFWQGWHLLEKDYYGDLPQVPEAARAALRGVVRELDDPHTVLVNPEYADILRQDLSGSFEGIGAVVRINEDRKLEIVETLEGRPAQLAGLRRGDIVLRVDDIPIENMNVLEAVALIRGPNGTVVRLFIDRMSDDRSPFEVSVTRRRIEIRSIQTRLVELPLEEGGYRIGYVELKEFNAMVPAQLSIALRDLLATQPDGLILDLRGNPGGYLHVAVAVASQFVGEGLIVSERRKGGEETQYPAQPGGLATDAALPLVVLVNVASASASEIVAGAIQDAGRGLLVGEATFGKGSVQITYTLDDGAELRITTARWFTPGGRLIHGEGLEPDIPVSAPDNDVDPGKTTDPQLAAALVTIADQLK